METAALVFKVLGELRGRCTTECFVRYNRKVIAASWLNQALVEKILNCLP